MIWARWMLVEYGLWPTHLIRFTEANIEALERWHHFVHLGDSAAGYGAT